MNAIEAQRVLWVSTSCGSIVLRIRMRNAQPMRVKQKLYTNINEENGSPIINNGNHESRRSDKKSPEKRKAPLLQHVPGLSHGCRFSQYEVA